MSFPAAPSKTPLGVEELRQRSLGLSQRHRTVLLLVDGRRSLGDVLGMALKAGAATTHLEDLVRLGLVELPVEAMAPEPQFTAPAPLDEPRLTSVEVRVEPEAGTGATHGLQVIEPVGGPFAGLVGSVEPLPPAAPEPAAQPAPPVLASTAAPAAPPTPPASAATPPGLTPVPPPPPTGAARTAPPPPSPPTSPEVVRARVRALLLTFVAAENSLVGSLMLTRIRTAHTQQDLIGLVWELERQRSGTATTTRKGHARLQSLQEARDLLGMGNTLVAGDSQHGGEWPDTHGRQ